MDARRFDALSRLVNASPTRRAALWAIASLGLFGGGDLLNTDVAMAKKGRKKKGKKEEAQA